MATNNGHPFTLNAEELAQYQELLTTNALISRLGILQDLKDPRRDINAECGYPEIYGLMAEQYRNLYDEFCIAARVVDLFPSECWGSNPQVYEDENEEVETEFEKAWKEVSKRLGGKSWFVDEETSPIWSYLERIDKLSGIGHFGLLLLGINDGQDLSTPVDGFDNLDGELGIQNQDGYVPLTGNAKKELLFLQCYDEAHIQVVQEETDRRNPRYGRPVLYDLRIDEPSASVGSTEIDGFSMRVHWSRVIHVAENLSGSESYAIPKMRPVVHRLLDLKKLYGGSAEMFWKGGFPGFSFETHPELGSNVKVDVEGMRKQIYDYQNGLQRYLSSTGQRVNQLAPQVSDPTPHIERQLEAICILLGVPKRVFMGSERGELASSQDRDTWDVRVADRQSQYLIPRLIVPFINRLILMGVLPEPSKGYHVKWTDSRTLTDIEKAELAGKRVEALAKYVGGGLDVLITPLDFLVKEMGYDREEAEELLKNTLEHINDANPEEDDVAVVGRNPKPEALSGGENDDEQEEDQDSEEQEEEKGPPKKGQGGGGSKPPTGNELVDNNCGVGPGGFQPGNTCAKGGGGGFPKSVDDLTHVSDLGGSTGATLMKDSNGKMFVRKSGGHADHIRSEFAADEIYRAAGVNVPEGKLYETPAGPVKVSEFIANGVPLGETSGPTKQAAIKEIQKDFALDATLGNWDVVGQNQDNILVTEDAEGNVKVHRIDNGGALAFRAQGAPKGDAWNGENSELETMRSNPKNPSAMAVYGSMTNDEISASITKMQDSKDSLIKKTMEVSPNNTTIIAERYGKASNKNTAYVNDFMGGIENPFGKGAASSVSTLSSGVGTLGSSKGVVDHLLSKASDTKMTSKVYQEKVAFLNPNGIENGTYYMPLMGAKKSDPVNSANVEKMKQILPPGTEIKTVFVSGKAIKAGTQKHPSGAKLKHGATSFPSSAKVKSPTAGPSKKLPINFNPDSFPGSKTITQGEVRSDGSEFGSKISLSRHGTEDKLGLKDLPNKATSAEKAALTSWKGSAADFRKRQAAGPGSITEKDMALRTLMDKAPVYKGTTFRGVHGEFAQENLIPQLKQVGVGGIWGEPNTPMCTSKNTATASNFASGEVFFKINCKTGADVSNLSGFEGEEEVMGKPGRFYKIKRIVENADLVGIGKVNLYAELDEYSGT